MREHRGRRHGRIVATVLGLAMAASVLTVAAPAQATFSGTNGLIAYASSPAGGDIFVINPSKPVPTQVTTTGNFFAVAFNAAANKLAASTTAGLVLLDPVRGSAVTPVPNTVDTDFSPSFNPSGNKLVFSAAGEGIATISTSGADRTTIVATGSALTNVTAPEWSSDGTFIVHSEDLANPSSNEIVRISPTGGSRTVLSPAGSCTGTCFVATISPDSKKVAYDNVTVGIGQVNADGSSAAVQLLTDNTAVGNPAYSPDGTQIVFVRGAAPGFAIHRAPTDGSQTATAITAIDFGLNVFQRLISWGRAAGSGTGTGTGSGTGSRAVISVAAVRNEAQCVFNITATPARSGITVDFSITTKGGNEKLAGNDVTVPASPSVKARKHRKNKVRNITLSDPKGATIGTSTATCAK